MKRNLLFISIITLIVLVSCGLTIGDDGTSKNLTSISFSDKATRALVASVNTDSVENIYWRYSAVKTDGGPAAGSTSSSAVTSPSTSNTKVVVGTEDAPGSGLGGRIFGFSTGAWSFNLYGYISAKDCKEANEYYAFYGKADNQNLQVGTIKKVHVDVSPDKNKSDSAKGKLAFVDIVLPLKGDWTYSLDGGVHSYSLGDYINNGILNLELDCDAGVQDIVLLGQYDGSETRCAKLRVAVYRGLTTTITGSVDDLQTAIKFMIGKEATDYYVVNYYYNSADASGDLPVADMYKTGTTVTVASETLTRTGYLHKGWNTKEDGTGQAYVAGNTFTIESMVDLYAVYEDDPAYDRWRLTYSVNTTDPVDGSVPETTYCEKDSVVTTPSLDSVSRTGYTLSGWCSNADGTGTVIAPGGQFNISYHTTLYAIWKPDTFGIIYRDMGNLSFTGLHAANYATVHTYGTDTALDSPVKNDNEFEGWHSASDCSDVKITTLGAKSVSNTESVTLYAKWNDLAPTGTKGVGTITVDDAGRTTCAWVQLWKKGPKFAAFNLGSTIDSYINITAYTTQTVGGLYSWGGKNNAREKDYINDKNEALKELLGENDTVRRVWGSNWEMTSIVDMLGLVFNCRWKFCDGSDVQFEPGCTLKGWKITGKGDYQYNSIFLPLAGYWGGNQYSVGLSGHYWAPIFYNFGLTHFRLFGDETPSLTNILSGIFNIGNGCSILGKYVGE